MDVPGDARKTWDACTQRKLCRTLTPHGVYLCTAIELLGLKHEACPYDRGKIEKCFSRDVPFEACSACGITPNKERRVPHESEEPAKDEKAVEMGMSYLRKTTDLIESGEL